MLIELNFQQLDSLVHVHVTQNGRGADEQGGSTSTKALVAANVGKDIPLKTHVLPCRLTSYWL